MSVEKASGMLEISELGFGKHQTVRDQMLDREGFIRRSGNVGYGRKVCQPFPGAASMVSDRLQRYAVSH